MTQLTRKQWMAVARHDRSSVCGRGRRKLSDSLKLASWQHQAKCKVYPSDRADTWC